MFLTSKLANWPWLYHNLVPQQHLDSKKPFYQLTPRFRWQNPFKFPIYKNVILIFPYNCGNKKCWVKFPLSVFIKSLAFSIYTWLCIHFSIFLSQSNIGGFPMKSSMFHAFSIPFPICSIEKSWFSPWNNGGEPGLVIGPLGWWTRPRRAAAGARRIWPGFHAGKSTSFHWWTK